MSILVIEIKGSSLSQGNQNPKICVQFNIEIISKVSYSLILNKLNSMMFDFQISVQYLLRSRASRLATYVGKLQHH
jgi:hypothetical protein